jgi:hypothetical protein
VVTDCQGCASGIDNLSNTLVRIPYNSSHLYDVTFTGRSGRMTLYSRGYARGGGSGDYTHVSGDFTVQIFDVETGTTKAVTEPKPGGSKFVDSPALPAALDCSGSPRPKGCSIFVDDQAGGQDPRGTVIAAEGDFERAPTAGEFVFWCWLNYDFTNPDGVVIHLPAKYQLGYCISMALYLIKGGKLGKPKPPAVRLSSEGPAKAEAAGCRAKAIPILLRKRGRKIVSLGQAKKAKLTSSSFRYGCSASGGKATITITAPRGLRQSLGKKLDLMVARAKNAPRRTGKLSITFGWK